MIFYVYVYVSFLHLLHEQSTIAHRPYACALYDIAMVWRNEKKRKEEKKLIITSHSKKVLHTKQAWNQCNKSIPVLLPQYQLAGTKKASHCHSRALNAHKHLVHYLQSVHYPSFARIGSFECCIRFESKIYKNILCFATFLDVCKTELVTFDNNNQATFVFPRIYVNFKRTQLNVNESKYKEF